MKPILVFIASILMLGSACVAQQPIPDEIKKAIGQLDSEDSDTREDAAELLAESVMPKTISPPLKKRLETESDFHVKLALNYALACQGEKSHVEPLIESLNQTGHLGYVYLRRVTGRDFEWNVDEYRNWFDIIHSVCMNQELQNE